MFLFTDSVLFEISYLPYSVRKYKYGPLNVNGSSLSAVFEYYLHAGCFSFVTEAKTVFWTCD